MSQVTPYSGTELHSFVPNFFLYKRLKKNRLYKTLLLTSILRSLLFTYYKLIRIRELVTRKSSTKNASSVSRCIYLTRIEKLFEKQHFFILDTITTRLKMQYFLNPYIPSDKWDAFLLFLLTPDSLESRLLKLNSERLTASSLDINNLLSVSNHKVVPIKKKSSDEILELFFNLKFNFVVNQSTLKTTKKLLGLGTNTTYSFIAASLYRKLDVLLETSEIVLQNVQNVLINGSHVSVNTFLITVGDILSYKASAWHSDRSVRRTTYLFNRRLFVYLHTLFSLNRIYTDTMWLKLRAFFFKVTTLFYPSNSYFFYDKICPKLVSNSALFIKTAFFVENTQLYRKLTSTTTIDSILVFSSAILQSRFFVARIPLNLDIIQYTTFSEMHPLIISMIQNFFTIMSTWVIDNSELFNLLCFLNRWLLFNNLSAIRFDESLASVFYTYYQGAESSMNLIKPFYSLSKYTFIKKLDSLVTYFPESGFFLDYYGTTSRFVVDVENLRSLQWSFFLNLKYNTLIAFNYLRWRHLDLEYLLFYTFDSKVADMSLWFHNHDKVCSDLKYNSIFKYN